MKKIFFQTILLVVLFFYNNLSAQVTNSSGTQLVASGDLKLVFNDLSLVNNGSILPATSTMSFTGANNQSVSGSSSISFYNLSVNKTSIGKILLQRNIDVNSNIDFSSGLLDLNNFNIILSATSLITGETENARITGTNGGYVQITTSLNAPLSANPGNLGAIFTSSTNFGSTIIRRGHAAQSKGVAPDFSINRYYDIIPANNTALNASLKFSYFDAEVNGKNEADLWLWKSSDFTNWFVSAATDNRDVTANYVTAKGIKSFSRWTLSDASFPTGTFGPCEGKNELKFWPNPFTDDFNLGVTSTKTSSASMLLFDVNGKLAASQDISINTGRNLFNFSFPKLPAGYYIIKIADRDCSTTLGQIIKLNK
jgi:hypothetical protein